MHWSKSVYYGPDDQVTNSPVLHLTPDEIDLVAAAIEAGSQGVEHHFTPSEGIQLSRIKVALDDAADWAEEGEDD